MHPELIMTAAKGGWAIVEIDHRLSANEIKYIIDDSEPKVLFVGRGLVEGIASIFRLFPELTKVTFPDDYQKIITSYSDKEPVMKLEEKDIITIMYTSGTTGQPKGVMYTHKNLIAAVTNMALTLDVSEEDKTLHTSPFSHIAPIWPFFLQCYFGGSSVIIDNLEPTYILETIKSERITTWNTVPIVIGKIVDTKGKERFDISSLRCITYGASPIALPVLKRAINYFGSILNQVYGCTEVYIITFLKARDHILQGSDEEVRRLASCGLEVINTETVVVNSDGVRVKRGEVGEIITRGDHVSPGYWRKENETRQSMKDGWFFTGDLATVDENGFIYISGRRKEIIISGGENVSPREVENVLYSHEAVKDAAAVGLPHDQWGEAVTAFVTLHSGKMLSDNDLLAYCRERLAGYKCPKAVIFLENLPQTSSGKILKRKLRDRFANWFTESK
jgi:acyl-CoA synthetase (AMP-forming)/AMP-acid ligase II